MTTDSNRVSVNNSLFIAKGCAGPLVIDCRHTPLR